MEGPGVRSFYRSSGPVPFRIVVAGLGEFTLLRRPDPA